MTQKALTDAQLKAKILAKAAAQEVKPDKQEVALFPTEIIDLPSRGLIYPKDNPLSSGKVEIKYMTAKEEDILTNPNYIKQGKALDKLYQAIIVGNGEGQPIILSQMVHGDKSAVMLAARMLGYGSDYEITVQHPVTGKSFKHTVDLSELKVKDIDYSKFNNCNEFEYNLPVAGKKVVFKLLTSGEQRAVEKLLVTQEKGGMSKQITTKLKKQIISIDGNDDKNFINQFIDNYLLAKDSLMLRGHINRITPDFDLAIRVNSPENDFDDLVNLPINVDFFWPRP